MITNVQILNGKPVFVGRSIRGENTRDFSSLKLKHSKAGRKFGNGQRGGKWYFLANGHKFTPEIAQSLGLVVRFKDNESKTDLQEVICDVDYLVKKYLKG